MPPRKVDDFTAESTGGPFALSAHRGHPVVLYFYPKDNTPGCTTEGAQFRDLYKKFLKAGAIVAGVSRDSLKSHAGFSDKMDFAFPLLSDPEKTTLQAWGAFGEKKMYGKTVTGVIRSTFLVDEDGKVEVAQYNVRATGHVAKLRRDLSV